MRAVWMLMAWVVGGLALVLQPFAVMATSASSWAERLAAAPVVVPAAGALAQAQGVAVATKGSILRVVQLEAGGVVVFSQVDGKLVSRYFRVAV